MSGLEQRALDLLTLGPLTALELGAELNIAEGTVWTVLSGLRKAGTVEIQHVRLRGRGNGSGRGRAIYTLAQVRTA